MSDEPSAVGTPTDDLSREQLVQLVNAYRGEYFVQQRSRDVDEDGARFALDVFEATVLT